MPQVASGQARGGCPVRFDTVKPGDMAGTIKGRPGWQWLTLPLLVALAACGSGVHYRPVSDTPVRIGKPYTVRGVTYVPAADPTYDMLGYASWYGHESGSQVANGERFRPDAITAANTTLPLPSYVEVTDLDSGHRIIVRVNDRGPFAKGRIIDLSRGAAEQLGTRTRGIARVRVRVVEPPEKDRKLLRDGKQARRLPDERPEVLANLREQFAIGMSGR